MQKQKSKAASESIDSNDHSNLRRKLLQTTWTAPAVAAVSLPLHAQATETVIADPQAPSTTTTTTEAPFVPFQIQRDTTFCFAAETYGRSMMYFENISGVNLDITSIYIPVAAQVIEFYNPGFDQDVLTTPLHSPPPGATPSNILNVGNNPVNITVLAGDFFSLFMYEEFDQPQDCTFANGLVFETDCCGTFTLESENLVITSTP